jgi:hypothetical protein
MGNWSINVQGVGCHHNNNPEIDANEAAKEFVRKLIGQGQTIHVATFTYGASDGLFPPKVVVSDDGVCGCSEKQNKQ